MIYAAGTAERGRVFADTGTIGGALQVYDTDGNLLRQAPTISQQMTEQTTIGTHTFAYYAWPQGIVADANGTIYVVEQFFATPELTGIFFSIYGDETVPPQCL